MPMELQGFDNLKDDLTNMASNLEFGAGVNRALQEGAKPIEEQMLRGFSPEERERFADYLDRAYRNLKEGKEEDPWRT